MGKIKNPKFEKAQKERERLQNTPEFTGYDIPKPEFLGLEEDRDIVFRIVGDPIEFREKGTDPDYVLQSRVLRDDGKGYCYINWKKGTYNGKPVPDNDWILTRLYNTVMEGEWKKYPPGKTSKFGKDFYKEYMHKDTESYRRIDSNVKKDERGIPTRFYPSKQIVMNVIDRMDDWCKENKHTKLLSRKIGKSESIQKDKDGKEKIVVIKYPKLGITETLYEKIWKHCIRFIGDWDCDLVVRKVGDREYDVHDFTEEKYLSEEIINLGSIEELTDEEKAYELYDIDKEYAPSSYNKLKKNLSGLFKMVDSEFGTTYYDELCDLAKIEQEEKDRSKAVTLLSEEDNDEDDNYEDDGKPPWDDDNEEIREEVEEEVEEEPKKRSRPKAVPTENEEVVNYNKLFPSWKELTSEEQKIMVNSIKGYNDDGSPIYYPDADDYLCIDEDNCFFPNTNKQTTYPSSVITCPVCGKKA